ncbi:hypothetical protein L484_020373 [Morus notabilis]|uniref:Uncharacterized protein n=1 Tax=Morus notabilis TaxID=981085 RepID=W9RN88_9ROSA|nr:hypothetical protein L484_020373 [Morus notabilis]
MKEEKIRIDAHMNHYNKASFSKNGIIGGRGFLQASVTAHGCVTLSSGLGSKEVSWPIVRPSSSITKIDS